MSDDPNRIVYYTCEITLLDMKLPNGWLFSAAGKGETPEEAYAKAHAEAERMGTAAARLMADKT